MPRLPLQTLPLLRVKIQVGAHSPCSLLPGPCKLLSQVTVHCTSQITGDRSLSPIPTLPPTPAAQGAILTFSFLSSKMMLSG